MISSNNIKIESIFSDLDKFQKKAILAEGNNTLITAFAGAGKTKCLINAIIYYRYEHLSDRICAITFTRAAKAEMEYRLKQSGINDVEVTTIHVWSRNLLEELAQTYDFKINILEKPAIMTILRRLISEGNSKLNAEILYAYINGNKKMDVSDGYLKSLESYCKKYIKYKRTNTLYDYTDYPLYLLDKLNQYKECIKSIDALFVDEFQDIDAEQFDIFEKVVCDKKFYIGDPWQSIYGFRGADMEVFNKLKNFNDLSLGYNYRSYQEIIDYAVNVYNLLTYKLGIENLLISDVTYSRECDITCVRGNGGQVYVSSPFGETKWIGHRECSIKEAFNFIWPKNPMILCRTNKQVKAIEELNYFNVSTVHQAKGLEYTNVIVIDDVIKDIEDLNIAYVAITRAKDNVFVANFRQLYRLIQTSIV